MNKDTDPWIGDEVHTGVLSAPHRLMTDKVRSVKNELSDLLLSACREYPRMRRLLDEYNQYLLAADVLAGYEGNNDDE